MHEPDRPRPLTPAEAARSPLIRKLKSLDDFRPDQEAIATAVGGEDGLAAELRRHLGLKKE